MLDILREGDTAYRYGGDEFAIILPETVKEGGIELAERLRRQFVKKNIPGDRRIKLTLSIGVAGYPEDSSDEIELVAVADCRMYHSKENGGNMTTAYRPHDGMDSEEDTILRSLNNLIHLMEKKAGAKSLSGISHSQEIRSLGTAIGRRLGLNQTRLDLFEQAAMLHDIGILYILESTRERPGKLNAQEWEEVKKHVTIGEQMLSLLVSGREDLSDLPNIVGQHHEWFDGSGYPRGLKGEETLIEARILTLTDAYSAMRSKRSYRPAKTTRETLAAIKNRSGIQFDPQAVEALIDIVADN